MPEKLPWKPEGYKEWRWKYAGAPDGAHTIAYESMGDPLKPPLLLIHGFGASLYHWRYNLPSLAKDYHVFAIDMLGFGGSSKPIMDYSAEVSAQC
jgi:pimeloyl-ACP methyl ester carboxylesterase